MFRVNNKNTRTTSLTLFGVFNGDFEHIPHLFSSVAIADLEQVNVSYIIWDKVFKNGPSKICGRKPFKNLR